MKQKVSDGIVVLFGATGDLAERMLFPSLHQLYQRGLLSEKFALIGAARSDLTQEEFQNHVQQAVEKGPNFEKLNQEFIEHCRYVKTDVAEVADLKNLRHEIELLVKEYGSAKEYTYYYSIPPTFYDETTNHIKEAGITAIDGNHRVVVEKPVGDSLETAIDYHELLLQAFPKENVYFMDHFPGMDFTQNILASRFYNPLIEGIWNNHFIENVQISLPENLSIGTRGAYYDENGVLFDMFQNHLLQILSMVAMELPDELTSEAIHEKKLDVLKKIPSYSQEEVAKKVVRGQYQADSEGQFNSYRREEDVAIDSDTASYIAAELSIADSRWEGVPFYLRTGKALIEHFTAVDIFLKPAKTIDSDVASRLTFMIEPPQGLSFVLNQKEPNNTNEPLVTFIGPDKDAFKDKYIPHPYENMIYNVLVADRTFFPDFEQIKEQWRITDSISNAWASMKTPDFPNYRANTFGPIAAENLLDKKNHVWVKRTLKK